MKVRLDNENKNNDIILSIGMIVKNEEKVLKRCLESLKSITERIKCEIIIADTGSTDSTVQIAKEYTDKVFHFEWINDFAAARNSTLEKAKGKWFLFIDADEYFDEDTSEIVNFFRIPELYNKYKCIEVILRSYTDDTKTFYRDAHLPRFHRIDDPADPVKFIGKVHEGIWIRQPLGYFSTVVHHTGYCHVSSQKSADKRKRNMVLMREEYEKDPEDIRLLSHLIDGCTNDVPEKEQYINKIVELVKINPTHLYRNVAYLHALSYYKISKPEYALDLYEEYFDNISDRKNYIATLGIYALRFNILSSLSRHEEAYEEYKKYASMYKRYNEQDDSLILDDLAASPITGLTEYEYHKNTFLVALSLKSIKRFDEAFKLLEQFDIEKLEGEGYRELLGTIRELCKGKKDYVFLAKYYEKACSLDSYDKKNLALYMMESTYYSLETREARKEYAQSIVNSGAHGKYIDLMRFIISQESDDFIIRLKTFIDSIDDWSDGYMEALNLAIKYKIDISDIVLKIKPDTYRSKLETIALSDDDFAQNVLEYGMPESYFNNIKCLRWITAMYEKASYRAFNLNNDYKYQLYLKFTSLLSDYVTNIYNPELLNDDDIDVLPALHRFGYHMYNANSALNAGDKIGYIRNMKKALLSCESMKEIVEFLLEEFKKKL